MPSPLALYIHWPFCVSKCPYCDFNSHVRETVDDDAWRAALLADMAYEAALTPGRKLTSIFFGGGTPSLMPPSTVAALIDAAPSRTVSKVVGVEARGFILAAPVAEELGAGFVPVRKPGKLPWNVVSQDYELEYGTDRLEIHEDAVGHGDTVLIVDDVLATGGTAEAAVRLVEGLGATVAGLVFLIELDALGGRSKLSDYAVASVLHF